jgi:hypothetical protein
MIYVYIYTYMAVVPNSYLQTAILCWKKTFLGSHVETVAALAIKNPYMDL